MDTFCAKNKPFIFPWKEKESTLPLVCRPMEFAHEGSNIQRLALAPFLDQNGIDLDNLPDQPYPQSSFRIQANAI